MPRKRISRKTKKLTLKQKKLLEKRLIEISMRIEDCVYKNRVISAQEAVTYIDEVTTCKQLCGDDARSLQVIEKITRCMNTILDEQRINNVNNSNTIRSCPSPVYSLPESDKTISPQILNANNEKTVTFASDIETIDLCDDNDVNAVNVQVDVEIHRAMSYLSVQDHDDDCSQSILENNDQLVVRTENIITEPTAKLQSSNNTKINNNDSPALLQINTNLKKHNIANPFQNNGGIIKKRGRKAVGVENKIKEKETKTIKKRNVKKTTGNNSERRKKNKKDDEPTSQLSKISVHSTNNDNDCNKITHIVTPAVSHNIISKAAIAANANMHKGNQLSINAATCATENTSNLNENKSIEKVYNRNVVIDLSWLENIRYVREVTPEEYDTQLGVDDNFWNNFYLPPAWDEQDFNY